MDKFLYITDQDEYSDHSFIGPLFQKYLTKHFDINTTFFSKDKENIENAVYGLPEYFRDEIKNAKLIANPGCYPTASLLALLPFIDYIDIDAPIFIDAKSGVSGAGKNPSETTHYCQMNDNVHAYNPFKHRHMPEIHE